MPVSSHEGKQWAIDRILELQPADVLDVGAGEGIWAMLMEREPHLKTFWVDALEIYAPYVTQFKLEEKYTRVYVGDARTWDEWDYDLVIFGDVLEHMTREDAIATLQKAQSEAGHVLVSIPIVEMPQGAQNGNEHEAHLHHWTLDEMLEVLDTELKVDDVKFYEGEQIGVFLWSSSCS